MESLRAAYERFKATGEMDYGALDPDIEWIEPREAPGSTTYRGPEGVRTQLKKFHEAWDSIPFETQVDDELRRPTASLRR